MLRRVVEWHDAWKGLEEPDSNRYGAMFRKFEAMITLAPEQKASQNLSAYALAPYSSAARALPKALGQSGSSDLWRDTATWRKAVVVGPGLRRRARLAFHKTLGLDEWAPGHLSYMPDEQWQKVASMWNTVSDRGSSSSCRDRQTGER